MSLQFGGSERSGIFQRKKDEKSRIKEEKAGIFLVFMQRQNMWKMNAYPLIFCKKCTKGEHD